MKQNNNTTGATLEQWNTLKENMTKSFYGAKCTKNRITLDGDFVAKFIPQHGIMEYDIFSAEMIFSRFPEKEITVKDLKNCNVIFDDLDSEEN
jgi:hypothetical protein